MRLLLTISVFFIMIVFPSATLWLRLTCTSCKLLIQVIAIALPLLLIGSIALIHHTSGNMRIIQWINWVIMLIYIPLDLYSISVILNWSLNAIGIRSNVVIWAGYVLAFAATAILIVGVAMRNHIKTKEITIESEKLPKEFDGLKIAHITDIHLGTLSPKEKQLKRIANKIAMKKPDILCFTGDLVNQAADEGANLAPVFSIVDATLGRYAVMGNHDYGDYYNWENLSDKANNLTATHRLYEHLGFELLLDSAIKLRRGDAEIGIIGVENCSAKHFHNYGNLAKATSGFGYGAFNILLSHDPTHWSEEVTGGGYPQIDLTLSGHTHGAQFGITHKKLKFSPSQWIYPLYDGLYEKNSQYLCISHGIGYVGIPYRFGMDAEIVVITLRCKKH